MYKKRTIEESETILDALKKMDELDKKLLIVFNNAGNYQGLLSVGDIQRAIIQSKPIDTKINKILRSDVRVAHPGDSFKEIKEMMFDFRMELCPVVDDQNRIIEVYFWEDIFGEKKISPKQKINLPVVIMAGGLGSRLRPLTHVIPKPLIPVKDKTIVEHIFERFNQYGCSSFYISVNYKSSLIEFYLKEQNLPYTINYFQEQKPLGTVGSLSLLKNELKETFFVSNCDILIEQDYTEILKFHKEHNHELTVIAALKNYSIPYGTINSGKDGQLISFSEKPVVSLKINSGMYILEPHLLNEIPENTFFHITDLIEKIKERNGSIGVFPVSEKSWKDLGEWKGYLNNSVK